MAILSGLTISGGGITIVGASTVAANDPYFMYNTLLLPGNGTNGAQNNTFLDGSTNNYAITRNGTVQGTLSPYGGNWSNYFDGSDYLTVPSTDVFAFGTGAYTIEAWVYVTSRSLEASIWATGANNNNFLITTGGLLRLYNGTSYTGTTVIPLNTWAHVAVVRTSTASNGTQLFVNGVSDLVFTDTTNQTSATTGVIGVNGTGGEQYFFGSISNLRVVKGTSVYTANFTPSTTPLTPITNTSLLTCADNRLIDDSINNFTVTRNGDVSVQKFSPFSPSSVTPTSYSGNFDGTGDYLSLATNAAFNITSGSTDSFICEFWVYFSSVAANTSLVDNGGLSGATFSNWQIALNASQQFRIIWGTSSSQDGILSSSVIPTVGQWYHVAMVKTNADWALFINSTRVISYNGINTASKDSATPLFIAYGLATTAGGNGFNGLISNVRIYKGATASAPYLATSTTITVPTSPLTSITNTSLLTCQSSTFIDNSTNNFAITAFGNSQPTQQNPFGFTTATTNGYTTNTIGGGGYFNGGSYLVPSALANTAMQSIANSLITIEFWVYTTAIQAVTAYTTSIFGQFLSAAMNGRYIISLGASSTVSSQQVGFGWTTSTSTSTGVTSNINLNQQSWNHVAITIDSTTPASSIITIYSNGVGQIFTGNNLSSQTVDNGSPFYIGGDYGSNNQFLNGYMSDFRFVRGQLVYKSNFVPPSQPITAITNTTLLLNMTNASIIDNAMMNNLDTVGNAQISTTQSKFGGSSMYFDGTGDWLVSPISTSLGMGSGDFTIELWVYATNPTYAQGFFHVNATAISGTVAGYAIGVTAAGAVEYYSGSTYTTSSSTVTANTWTHLALVRSTGTVKVYVNGVLPTSGGSIADSQNVTTALAYIGVFYTVAASTTMTGYINDFRVTKGYARYTTNFTPSATAFPVY